MSGVMQNYGLVRMLATVLNRSLPPGQVELDDLISSGALGLVQAVERFDPSSHVAFSAYARHRILGAMRDYLRSMDTASQADRKITKRVQRVHQDLAGSLGHEPTSAEMAAELAVSTEEYEHLLAVTDRTIRTFLSLSDPAEHTQPQQYSDITVVPADVLAMRHQMTKILDAEKLLLPNKQYNILRMFYAEGKTLLEISVVYHQSRANMKLLKQRALDTLKEHLQQRNLSASDFSNP